MLANSVDPDQTPRSARLIWVCTACQSPQKGTPGSKELTFFCIEFNAVNEMKYIMYFH